MGEVSITAVSRAFVRQELHVLATPWIGMEVMVETTTSELSLGTCASVGLDQIGFTGIVE